MWIKTFPSTYKINNANTKTVYLVGDTLAFSLRMAAWRSRLRGRVGFVVLHLVRVMVRVQIRNVSKTRHLYILERVRDRAVARA